MKPGICFKKAAAFLAVLSWATALTAQTRIENSVFGNGSTPTGDGSNRIIGTVGQPAIGQAAGGANGVAGGFWAQNADVVTSVAAPLSEAPLPQNFRLHQNFPNPFNPETTIRYDLAGPAEVRLTVYDVLGRRVRTLVAKKQAAGEHSAVWDGRDDRGRQLASGVYVYRLEAGDFTKSAKMLLLK